MPGDTSPDDQVIGRIEVIDYVTDAYVPDATVTLLFSGGQVSKKTSMGGDASFSLSDLGGLSEDALRSATYLIERSGYEPQETPFLEREIVTVALVPDTQVIVNGAPPEFPLTTVLAVSGGVVGVGVLVALLV